MDDGPINITEQRTFKYQRNLKFKALLEKNRVGQSHFVWILNIQRKEKLVTTKGIRQQVLLSSRNRAGTDRIKAISLGPSMGDLKWSLVLATITTRPSRFYLPCLFLCICLF